MLKIIFISAFLIIVFFHVKAQTATDFNITDCSGNPHHLFEELDSGKVVIIDFVMPCPSCITPSILAYQIFQNYQQSYPGRILFYLSDGFGNHLCDTLQVWAVNNNINVGAIIVSTPAVTSLDYNGLGMPKIVVLGGKNHHVFFDKNDNDANDSLGLVNAIDSALHASDGVFESALNNFKVKLSPNPASDILKISFTLEKHILYDIEIFNSTNERIYYSTSNKGMSGKQEKDLSVINYPSGNYFFKISTVRGSCLTKFSIVR